MLEKIKNHIYQFWFSYLLSTLAIYFFSIRGSYTFLDFIDLLIHEPGHLIFSLFGRFLQFLGGTMMQIILPLSMAIVFFIKGSKYWTQIFLFWLGHNFLNISVYVDDANKMRLHIVGGAHDWNWILNRLGLIEYAEGIAMVFVGMAIVSFIFMFFIPYFLRNYDEIDLNSI